MPDGEIEDRHDGVADGLVEEPVMVPDGVGAFVVERVQQLRDLVRRKGFGQGGVIAQIGEQDGRVHRDLSGVHDPREHQLADRAGVGIHPARPYAQHSEGRRYGPAQGYRNPQLLPAALADRSEEHTSELQSLMRISYAVFCLKKKKTQTKSAKKKTET